MKRKFAPQIVTAVVLSLALPALLEARDDSSRRTYGNTDIGKAEIAKAAVSKKAAAKASVSTMLVQNGPILYSVPVKDFPMAGTGVKLKDRTSISMWRIESETIESPKQEFKEGPLVTAVRTVTTKNLVFEVPPPETEDCGIEETWIKASKRTAVDPSYQTAVKNEKTGSKHFRNWKGFEIPAGFVRVDTAKENSLLKELTTKSNGDFASAAEFKSGEARFYIVPLGSDDEFRVFYQLYYRADAKSGLKEVAKIDFVESCP